LLDVSAEFGGFMLIDVAEAKGHPFPAKLLVVDFDFSI